MFSHYRSAIFQILLIAWVLGSSSIVIGQSPERHPPAADSSKEPLPPVPAPSPYRQRSLRKFTFKHAKAADVLKICSQLSGEDLDGLAVDERTNSLIFLADDEVARKGEEFYTLLDVETPTPANTFKGISLSVPAIGPTPLTFDFERSESLESLKQRYNELEQQTHQLADKLKQSKLPSEPERTELKTAVRKSFEARQALQRAELAELGQRMKSMKQSIDMRDKLTDKVVERRVEDLLNPNLKWDAGKVSEQLLVAPNQSSGNPARPLPPSAFPSNVSMPYVPAEPPATAIRKRIQGRWIVTHSDGNKDALPDSVSQVEVEIDGNSLRYLVGKQDTTGPIFLADCKEIVSPTLSEEGPLPIDFIYDPNGDPKTFRGIIACDGTTLSICMASDEGRANKDFRPSLFVPGTKVTLIKCHRAEPETANAVSVDKATWKSRVQHATSILLAAFPVPSPVDQNDAPKVIAIVDVDYQGKQDASNLQEEVYQWIAADIPFARAQGSYGLLSRSAVKLAMQETGLRPRDLTRSNPYYIDNRQKLLKQLRSHELKVDALFITSLKHLEDEEDANPSQFEITLEGFIDARTTNWLERVNIKGKADGQSREPLSNSLPQLDTPQALLARVDESSKAGSYEEFIALFSDGGARDLAGSLLMQAVMQTSIDELSRQLAFGVAEVDPDFAAFRKVLQRWLPQSVTTAQQEAMGKGLSTVMSSIGGASPDQAAMKEFATSMRKSVEGISDHRKFCIEIMQAFEKLTTRKFVYFGTADQINEWQISQFSDRAIATLIDGSPGMATTITLQQASGDWRISSLFNEVVKVTKEVESGATPTTPSMEMQQRLQGEWEVKVFQSDGEGSGGQAYQVVIRGKILLLQTVVNGKVIGAYPYKLVWPNSDHPYEVDVIHDPNDNNVALPGRIACDNNSFQIVFGGPKNGDGTIRRPSEICPVENAVYIDCVRNMVDHRHAPIAPLKTSELSDADLSTPEATLDTIHRYSVDHPMGVPVECFTEPGLQELSGVMLQQLCFMSGLSQVGLQTGGVIGVKDNVPMVAGTAPSFHLSVDALLKDHSLPKPPEECTKAFELLAKLTLGAAFGSDESLVKPDRELFRLAAGILKSPKDFLSKAGKLSERFNDIPGDTDAPKKESKAQPQYLIEINGDEATATEIIDSDKPSIPMSFKLQRINQRWLVSEAFSDEILAQIISSMSQVLGAMSASDAEVSKQEPESLKTRMKEPAVVGETGKPLYSRHPISWWLERYWQNAMENPKTKDNETEEIVATIAIRKLCELPECDSVIETELAKWTTSVENEVYQGTLVRAAKCIVTIAGPMHQETAVNLLFKIWKRMPLLTHQEQVETADDATELNQLLSQLVLNDQLAAQFADRLTNGDSSDRSLVLYGLLSLMGRFSVEANKDLTELENWLRKHAERLAPAIEAASKDENEHIRFTSLMQLATLNHATKLDPESVRLPTFLLNAASDAAPMVRYMAIELLSSNELAPAVKSQSVQVIPMLISAIESDSSIDVRKSALSALMQMNVEGELVHKTLMAWVKSDDCEKVKYALELTLRNHQVGDRPQSIDELIELLSDPEWGNKVEVKENNWSTYHRWARQYAIAILGRYAAHAHRAISTLEAEVARKNKDTLSFATEALDIVRGYCPDLPIDKLQGEWEFVSIQKPEGSSPFFDYQASSDQQPSSAITISGTQLKLGDRVLAELSHYRSGSRQGVALLLDPDGKKRHCNGRYGFKGGPSPEYKPNVAPAPELLILDVCELLNNWDATQTTKQIYEFRSVRAVTP